MNGARFLRTRFAGVSQQWRAGCEVEASGAVTGLPF